MLHEIIQFDYATVIIILCLLLFIKTNSIFEKKIVKTFSIASIMVLILVAADSIEYWTASFSYATRLRIWMSAIGYTLRPYIIYMIIRLVTRNQAKRRFIHIVPCVLNMIIAFSALFTDIAYTYSADNQFVRGPLGYAAFIASGYYLIVLLYSTISLYKDSKTEEAYIVVAIMLNSVTATTLETIWHYEGLINVCGAMSMAFYYLYLNVQLFKRDPLTNALNRRCFLLDSQKHFVNLCALISIDLNELKKINDNQGHAQGDIAICTMVAQVRTAMASHCYLYRTGGDEFAILCYNREKAAVSKMVTAIKKAMSDTPYSCAIGVAYTDGIKNFDQLCTASDEAMYEDKMKMKAAAQ